jgi:hypothetical protein
MGEWSEYFEDFPEENPANWVNGRFDPAAAARLREIEEKKTIAKESQALQKKMFQMANEAKQKAMQREIENNTEKSNDTGL